jgi:Holliday junction DNA helicase RuvA
MIGKLSGIIDWKGLDQVLLDVRGVGYIVHVNDRTLAALPGVGGAAALYTDLLVREDLLQLFGFLTLLDREWHKLLMTVQGVGAKASMSMLGARGGLGGCTLDPVGTRRRPETGAARDIGAEVQGARHDGFGRHAARLRGRIRSDRG